MRNIGGLVTPFVHSTTVQISDIVYTCHPSTRIRPPSTRSGIKHATMAALNVHISIWTPLIKFCAEAMHTAVGKVSASLAVITAYRLQEFLEPACAITFSTLSVDRQAKVSNG